MTAWSVELFTKVILDALFGPKNTVVPGVNPVPVMVTLVPPVVGPVAGVTDFLDGRRQIPNDLQPVRETGDRLPRAFRVSFEN